MKHYYNENSAFPAQWLRNLMDDGLIPKGVVDERDIREVKPEDVRGYTQCHFFAGIGGWAHALRLAGWPDDRPVWTASCPCQPFSLGGDQEGTADHRDLWLVFARLAIESGATAILGEQVKDAIRWGWLDRLCDDMESADYSIGSAILPASAVKSIQERQRLWWFAVANSAALHGNRMGASGARGSSEQSGGLPGLHVAGRWWNSAARPERMPTLVWNFNGLSGMLGGFGNAIVPEVAKEFIQAAMECLSSSPSPCQRGRED